MSNCQLNKLKPGVKNCTEVTLNLSTNVISNSNGEYNLPNKIINNTQFWVFGKLLQMAPPANMKSSKTQLHKTG